MNESLGFPGLRGLPGFPGQVGLGGPPGAKVMSKSYT